MVREEKLGGSWRTVENGSSVRRRNAMSTRLPISYESNVCKRQTVMEDGGPRIGMMAAGFDGKGWKESGLDGSWTSFSPSTLFVIRSCDRLIVGQTGMACAQARAGTSGFVCRCLVPRPSAWDQNQEEGKDEPKLTDKPRSSRFPALWQPSSPAAQQPESLKDHPPNIGCYTVER